MKNLGLFLVISAILLYNLVLTGFPLIGFIFLAVFVTGILFYVSASIKKVSEISKIDDYSKLLICFMIIPFIRITELFIEFDFFYKLLIISVMVIFVVFYFSYYFKIKIGYTPDYLFLIPVVILIGELLGVLGYIILEVGYSSYLFLLVMPLVSYAQEIYFRGLIQNLIKNRIYSALFPGLLYFAAVLSFGFKPALFLASVFLVFSFIYLKTKNIFLTILGNITMSLVLFGLSGNF